MSYGKFKNYFKIKVFNLTNNKKKIMLNGKTLILTQMIKYFNKKFDANLLNIY